MRYLMVRIEVVGVQVHKGYGEQPEMAYQPGLGAVLANDHHNRGTSNPLTL